MFEMDWGAVSAVVAATLGAWGLVRCTPGRPRWLAAAVLLLAGVVFPPTAIVALAVLWSGVARRMMAARSSLWALIIELAVVAAFGRLAPAHPALAPTGAALVVLALRGLWLSWDQDRAKDGEPHGFGLVVLVVAAGSSASVSRWIGPWAAAGAYGAATLVNRDRRDPAAWAVLLSFCAWGARVALGQATEGVPSAVAVSWAGHALAVPWATPLLVLADAPASTLGSWALVSITLLLVTWARDPIRPSRVAILAGGTAGVATGSPSAAFVAIVGTVVLAALASLLGHALDHDRWTAPRIALPTACVVAWLACWAMPLTSTASRASRLSTLHVPGSAAYSLARSAENAPAREALLREAWVAALPTHELRGWVGLELGDALSEGGGRSESLRVWEDAARQAPLNARLLRALAVRFERAAAPQLARQQWMRLGAADPQAEAEWTRGVATSFLAAGDWAEVTHWARRSNAAAEHPDCWRMLATASERQGRLTDAVAALQRVHHSEPDDLEALRRLADLSARCGRDRESLEAWERVLAAQPRDARARLALAERSLAAGRRDEATAHVGRAEIDATTPASIAARLAARREELATRDGSTR